MQRAMAPSFIPRNRRPSRISHRANLEANYRQKTPVMPPDGDTFYYDPAFTSEWNMPPDLWVRLPVQLTDEIKSWQAAGAAVLTVLARYDKLELEAITRGWPEQKNLHLSRTNSYASPVLQSPTSSALGSPLESEQVIPPQSKLTRRARKDSSMPAILDTPPFTPQDSNLSDQSIAEQVEAPAIHNEADLNQVNTRLANMGLDNERVPHELSPITTPTSRRSCSISETPCQPVFDEAAWDVYINSCKAELEQLRKETLVRFRHLGRGIDRLWHDLKSDHSHHMLMGASMEFVSWWESVSGKAQQCEDEVRVLELPDLDEVKMEREAHGLPI